MHNLLDNLPSENRIEIVHQILLSLDIGCSVDKSNHLLNQAIKDIEEIYGRRLADLNEQTKKLIIDLLYDWIDEYVLEPLQTDSSIEKADKTLRIWRESRPEKNFAPQNLISVVLKNPSDQQIAVYSKVHKGARDRLNKIDLETLTESNIGVSLEWQESIVPIDYGEYRAEDLDPRIKYPSYKSFDEFIDIERLKSLDSYLTQKISRHMQAENDLRFYTGPYRLQDDAPDRPGSRMIYLAASSRPDSYFDLDKTEYWSLTEHASEFALLMDFIRTLPFKATGRMLIMYDDAPRPVPSHRDHIETEICHEFLWFRTNKKKPFFMLNHHTGEKQYVEHYSAWFDSVNQFHGSDPVDGLSFSIRVDGLFTDEFKAKIPKPDINLASTPALWACLDED